MPDPFEQPKAMVARCLQDIATPLSQPLWFIGRCCTGCTAEEFCEQYLLVEMLRAEGQIDDASFELLERLLDLAMQVYETPDETPEDAEIWRTCRALAAELLERLDWPDPYAPPASPARHGPPARTWWDLRSLFR